MHKFFNNILESLAKNFSQDASKMLIITSAAGWALSSLAQICGILFNPDFRTFNGSEGYEKSAVRSIVCLMAFAIERTRNKFRF